MNNDGGLTFNNEGGDGDLAQGRNLPPMLRTARPRIMIGNSEVPSATGKAPSEGIKSNQAEVAGAESCDNGNINEGSDCVNKVVPRFGAEDDNDGKVCVNKVASSFVAGDGSGGGETSCDLSVAVMGCVDDTSCSSVDALGMVPDSKVGTNSNPHELIDDVSRKHAKVACKSIKKYRITVKGPATCGAGCCRGT